MSDEDVRMLALPEIERAEERLAVISQDWALRAHYEQRIKAEMDERSWRADHLELWESERQKLEEEKQKLRERAEQAEQAARQAVLDMCELLGIAVTAERQALLEKLDLGGLEQLRQHLKQQRAWPA
jgi:hypothetical protein